MFILFIFDKMEKFKERLQLLKLSSKVMRVLVLIRLSAVTRLSPPQSSLSCCFAALSVKVVVGFRRGKNGSARGMPGRGKREERPLPYFVRLAG